MRKNCFILCIGIFCFIYVILYYFFLVTIEAPFALFVPMCQILSQLSFAVLASSIFYWISVYYPRKRDIRKVDGYIKNALKNFITLSERIDIAIIGETDLEKKYWIREFRLIFFNKSKIPYPIPPHGPDRFECWLGYFRFIFDQEDKNIKKLFYYSEYLPVDIINFVTKIEKEDGLRFLVEHEIRYYYDWMNVNSIPEAVIDDLCEKFWNHRESLRSCITEYEKNKEI